MGEELKTLLEGICLPEKDFYLGIESCKKIFDDLQKEVKTQCALLEEKIKTVKKNYPAYIKGKIPDECHISNAYRPGPPDDVSDDPEYWPITLVLTNNTKKIGGIQIFLEKLLKHPNFQKAVESSDCKKVLEAWHDTVLFGVHKTRRSVHAVSSHYMENCMSVHF